VTNDARAFLLKLDSDPALSRRVHQLYLEALERVAGEAGYRVTADELSEAAGEAMAGGLLSDDDLDRVAGGNGTQLY
jgi:predicted ribosomally synthesized peptide with nif11-like leader